MDIIAAHIFRIATNENLGSVSLTEDRPGSKLEESDRAECFLGEPEYDHISAAQKVELPFDLFVMNILP